MFDENKTLKAKDILKNPDNLLGMNIPYLIVQDTSVMMNFHTMQEALTILYDAGWEVHQMNADSGYMFALMFNTHYKRKNTLG